MTRRQTTLYWASAGLAFLLFLWIFSGMLGPFLFGAAIAYLTDPIADRMEALGLSRVAATLVITVCAFLVVVIAIFSLAPIIIDQAQELIQRAPRYIEDLMQKVHAFSPGLVPNYWQPVGEGAQASAGAAASAGENNGNGNGNGASLAEPAARWGLNALKGLVSGGLAFIQLLGVVVITPIVAFYLLLDWDRAIAAIDDLLPRKYVDTIRKLAREIDATLSAFLRGQLLVCLILGSFYAVALTLAGLPFGALVGIFAGIISFVPFVGSMVGLLLSVGIALSAFWGDWWHIGLVAGIFLTGQAVEGNILTPLMVGDRVGLHPVWLIFALSAFGFAFGFPGILVAVPMAASIGVIARWGTQRYQESQLYQGRPDS